MPIFEYRCRPASMSSRRWCAPVTRRPAPSAPASSSTKLLSLPAIKSDCTHALAMRAAQKRDKVQQGDKAREQREYELSHDD